MEVTDANSTQWWRWSAFGLLLVAPIAAIITQNLAPTPHGHWSSHLGNVASSAGQLAVVVAATWLLVAGRRLAARRWPAVGCSSLAGGWAGDC
jgi:hypothetical protein